MSGPGKYNSIIKKELSYFYIDIHKTEKFKIHLYNDYNCTNVYFTSLLQVRDWISEEINTTPYDDIWTDLTQEEIKICRSLIIEGLYLKVLKEWEETGDLKRREKGTGNKDNNSDSLKQTAYHEAGHAVVSYRLIHVRRGDISIRPGSDISGNNYTGIFEGGTSLEDRDDFNSKEREIITRYAGYEAELLFNPDADSISSKNDFEEAKVLFKDENNYKLGELKKIAHKIVQENKAEIQTLAEELFDKQFLGKKEWESMLSRLDLVKSGNDGKTFKKLPER